MKAMICSRTVLMAVVLLVVPLPAIGQEHGSGGGGAGGGCGDVFGDLIHILRDDTTGQPILAMRWVELPAEVPGYGWGYCPIAVDEFGNELGFAPLSCDVAEEDAALVVEVDYFGRLNGGRTKERNQRMHFNEVIDNIKASCSVAQDETGRLKIAYCDDNGVPEEWAVVDSPMESMGLYVRLMKYGHIQTNPDEEDYWIHGDPATGPQLQPALGPEDWLKFDESVQHLLPGWYEGRALPIEGESVLENEWISSCFTSIDGNDTYSVLEPFTDVNKNGLYDPPAYPYPGEPFNDLDGDGVRDDSSEPFTASCAEPESLANEDFIRAGSFMGAAANKTGWITADLVQYFNRIVKITKKTAHTEATPSILPALVRICTVTGELDPDDESQEEPIYSDCTDDNPADSSFENADLFPDVLEGFVDFSVVDYLRQDWRDETVEGIFPVNGNLKNWKVYSEEFNSVVPIIGWLESVNGHVDAYGIHGFVGAASDALRSIEFVHNHAIPVDLWPEFEVVGVP